MPSVAQARSCGHLNGLIGGLIFGLVLGGVVAAQMVTRKNEDGNRGSAGEAAGVAVAITVGTTFLSWWLGGVIAGAQKQGQDAEMSGFERSGLSKKEALDKIQDLENNKRTSGAIAEAGLDIASSMMANQH